MLKAPRTALPIGVRAVETMTAYIDRVTMPQRLGGLAAAATALLELALAVMALIAWIASVAIFVAMIMLKQNSVFIPGQHPRSRAVLANNERNADAILFA